MFRKRENVCCDVQGSKYLKPQFCSTEYFGSWVIWCETPVLEVHREVVWDVDLHALRQDKLDVSLPDGF